MDDVVTVLAGVPWTLALTVGGVLVGSVGGIPLVLARRSRTRLVRAVARLVIELLRGIPPIVWLFIIFFGVGASFPDLSPLTAALIGIGLISCGYLAEIYRGGWMALAPGQAEASAALGMSRTHTLVDVIAPQVFRNCIPAAATYAIGLLKDSSVAYTIGVTDVMYYANQQSHVAAAALVPFFVAGAIYVALTAPCAVAARALNARLQRAVAR